MDESPRRKVFAANWKMHKTAAEAREYIEDLCPLVAGSAAEIVVFPGALSVPAVAEAARGSNICVGLQNICWAGEGAYTGEISAAQAAAAGVQYVICGHSERRHIFDESGELVTRKARAAQSGGLIPLICVGETADERRLEETEDVLRSDIFSSLAALEPDGDIIIAYEPVWAIGTGQNATADDAEREIAFIRALVAEQWDADFAAEIRILYGGSVNPDNIGEFMAMPNIDGVLVGGASLEARKFAAIVNYDEQE
ncbi:MAG: triose-phosphate isomerase [Bacillota bacterium]|nr:triose-phosphate isomerase [Bacillota bacterium]